MPWGATQGVVGQPGRGEPLSPDSCPEHLPLDRAAHHLPTGPREGSRQRGQLELRGSSWDTARGLVSICRATESGQRGASPSPTL